MILLENMLNYITYTLIITWFISIGYYINLTINIKLTEVREFRNNLLVGSFFFLGCCSLFAFYSIVTIPYSLPDITNFIILSFIMAGILVFLILSLIGISKLAEYFSSKIKFNKKYIKRDAFIISIILAIITEILEFIVYGYRIELTPILINSSVPIFGLLFTFLTVYSYFLHQELKKINLHLMNYLSFGFLNLTVVLFISIFMNILSSTILGSISRIIVFSCFICLTLCLILAYSKYNKQLEIAKNKIRETLEERLRTEKLTAIGKLAGTIGHELRNPLGVISNCVYYLNTKLKDADEKVKKHLGMLENEVNRANKIINDLLDFTRTKLPVLEKANVNILIKNTLQNIKIPEKIILKFSENPDLPVIMLDHIQIQQVFQNLITNAIEAMPNGGTLEILTSTQNNFMKISFKDTGVGIPKENFQKIFEPLFSTKTKGIGLGLPFSKDIIELHNGEIEFDSKEGIGSVFSVIIPIEKRGGVVNSQKG